MLFEVPDGFVDVVCHQHQPQIGPVNRRFGGHVAQQIHERLPIGDPDKNDGEVFDLAGLNQRERFE